MEHEERAEELFSHRIPMTIIISVIALCFVVSSIALLAHKDTFIARRKAFQYMIISTVGLLFYLRDTLEIVWYGIIKYNNLVYNTYMYYLIAVPLHFFPVLVRSWRIFCVYKSTPTWKCRMEPIISRRRRGHTWMISRICVLYIPWAIVGIGLQWNTKTPYYVYIGLNGVVALANFVLTILLHKMRKDLKPKYLDEANSLLIYSVISLVEWIWANNVFLVALFRHIEGLMIWYIYVDVTLVFIMWFLTTGKTLYRVWIRRDLAGDKKPELEECEIQRALQRVSQQLLQVSSNIEVAQTIPTEVKVEELDRSRASIEITSTSDLESDVQKAEV